MLFSSFQNNIFENILNLYECFSEKTFKLAKIISKSYPKNFFLLSFSNFINVIIFIDAIILLPLDVSASQLLSFDFTSTCEHISEQSLKIVTNNLSDVHILASSFLVGSFAKVLVISIFLSVAGKLTISVFSATNLSFIHFINIIYLRGKKIFT